MDYLKLPGQTLRIEVNWNAIADFCELKGIKDLTELDDLSKMTAKDLLDFIYCAAKEGERMDGKAFKMTAKDLGSGLKTSHIVEFMHIYRNQSDTGLVNEGGKESTKKKKRKFFSWQNSRV